MSWDYLLNIVAGQKKATERTVENAEKDQKSHVFKHLLHSFHPSVLPLKELMIH